VPWVFFTVMMSTVNIDPLRRSALLIVDMQNDFIDPKDGSLYVPGGEQILPTVQELKEHFRRLNLPVLYSGDAHEEDDPEFQIWPRHCVRGTWGSQIHPAIQPDNNDKVFHKQQYSVFTSHSFESTLKQMEIEQLFIAGVATNYCVKAAAVDAQARSIHAIVILDATKGIEPLHEAISEMEQAGVTLTNSQTILNSSLFDSPNEL
jgi:nicotinamidase/pyrazinamidase